MNATPRELTDADLRHITDCLGRTPKGVVGVAARDRQGRPSVITNAPLIRDAERWLPFPTLYWLVDPALNSAIAEIERKGGVRAIETALQQDEALLTQHLEDNRHYAAKRWSLLDEADKRLAEEKGLVAVLRDAGVGGVANHHAIKCLHAQAAYHLARDNGTAVGGLIDQCYDMKINDYKM